MKGSLFLGRMFLMFAGCGAAALVLSACVAGKNRPRHALWEREEEAPAQELPEPAIDNFDARETIGEDGEPVPLKKDTP